MNAKKHASRRILKSDLARVDAHVIRSSEYEELPELSEEIVNALPNEHVDLVYCGRARSRHIPRDSLVAKVTPQVVISSGTKAEIAGNSIREQVHYLYLKQDGAITAERSGSDLFIHAFCGTVLRLTARSR